MRMSDVTVVKLGGSHAGSQRLGGWLDALAGCGGRVVLIPGGGAFADAVRQAQPKLGFDDATAHHMALLAMEQYGRALASLRRGFRIAASITAIRCALRDGRVPVWAPTAMVLRAKEIPASWDVTSDSLAAWLAGQIGVRRLLLIKYTAHGDAPASAADLAACGVVDRAFPRFLAASGAEASIAGAADHAGAAAILRSGGFVGVRIGLHEREARRLLSPLWPRSRHRAGVGR
jgi:5-(aminomethyl)-3-furanmethanol phosphate kinase